MMLCNREKSSIAFDPATSGSPIPAGLFRPWAVAFIGLAILVTLWGFGNKLTRYNLHPDAVTRALVAKLWDKHQDVSQLVASSAASAQQTQSPSGLHALLLLLFQTPELEQDAFSLPDECRPLPVFFHSVVPLRSPPSNILVG